MTMFALPILTGGVVVYLHRTGRISRILCLCLLAGVLAAAGSLALEKKDGSRQEVTELPMDGGEAAETVPLTVESEDGMSEQVEIRVPGRKRSSEEAVRILEETAAELDRRILGKNTSLEKVEWDLTLPGSFEDTPVTAAWTTDQPDVLHWDGVIGTAASPEGSPVTLRAELKLEEETLEFSRSLIVYPSRETGTVEKRLQEKSNALNEGSPGESYRLPGELDGSALTWYREIGGSGQKICLIVLMAAGLAAVSASQRKEEDRKKRNKELLRYYPEMLSKTHLLLAAGLSLRKVFERLAADYRRERKRSSREHPAGEEILRTLYEMENGVLEQDAFTHLGERCGLAEYKTFALLLAQNQKKGGYRLPQLLEKEVQDAFEARKRKARIAGEKAAIKLALPMGMMLIVVLVIIMVPALLSF